jgi:hypothetical protein
VRVPLNRISVAATVGIMLMITDMILHPSNIDPFWSEAAIIGLVGYIFTFIALTIRSSMHRIGQKT